MTEPERQRGLIASTLADAQALSICRQGGEKLGRLWHHGDGRPTGTHMPGIDADVLGRLYRQHAPALHLYARQWPGGGDDFVQEAFLRLAGQKSLPDRILPWLYRVVR